MNRRLTILAICLTCCVMTGCQKADLPMVLPPDLTEELAFLNVPKEELPPVEEPLPTPPPQEEEEIVEVPTVEPETEPSILPEINVQPLENLPAYAGMVDLEMLQAGFVVDLQNATTNNVTGEVQYPLNKALVQRDMAAMLLKAQAIFVADGYRMKIWDAYRPKSVQAAMCDTLPANMKYFIPYPDDNSQHCRGVAVDITLVDENGVELDMPTGFCEFNPATNINYDGATEIQKKNRDYMRGVMESLGFLPLTMEWWHYYMPGHKTYQLLDFSNDDFNRLAVENPSETWLKPLSPTNNLVSSNKIVAVDGLVDLVEISRDFVVQLANRTANNPTGAVLYNTNRCLIHQDALNPLLNAKNLAMAKGYKLVILDSYRPQSINDKLYQAIPDGDKLFFDDNPGHTSGTAVDVMLVDANGKVMPMPTPYMTYQTGSATPRQAYYENLLTTIMMEAGFLPGTGTWWHYYLPSAANYTPKNISFADYDAERYKLAHPEPVAPPPEEVTPPVKDVPPTPEDSVTPVDPE